MGRTSRRRNGSVLANHSAPAMQQIRPSTRRSSMNRAVTLTVLGICLTGLFALRFSTGKGAAQEYSEIASKSQVHNDKGRCKDLPGEKQLRDFLILSQKEGGDAGGLFHGARMWAAV